MYVAGTASGEKQCQEMGPRMCELISTCLPLRSKVMQHLLLIWSEVQAPSMEASSKATGAQTHWSNWSKTEWRE